MKLRIGSRESRLAVIQSEILIDSIKNSFPDIETELITMKTTGDKILDKTLDKIGGKGLFVKELDAALISGRVDFTVHSCKDLPMEENPELPIAAFSAREDARDALVLPEGAAELDLSKPIGCSSLRRRLQLMKLYPQARIEPVRGNVQTRLRKLDSGEFSALVLAAAGLKRLGLQERISRYFTTDEILPAAGQGILAVQCRAGESTEYLAGFADENGAACALAERAYVRKLDGGCSSPIAAHAVVEGGILHLRAMDARGVFGEITGNKADAAALGEALGERMLKEASK
ncbi:MAG: hydroxymethylbilane synthase [Candidatus Heteroscillospira sp.]